MVLVAINYWDAWGPSHKNVLAYGSGLLEFVGRVGVFNCDDSVENDEGCMAILILNFQL